MYQIMQFLPKNNKNSHSCRFTQNGTYLNFCQVHIHTLLPRLPIAYSVTHEARWELAAVSNGGK